MKIYVYDEHTLEFIKETYPVLDLEASRQHNTPVYTYPKCYTEKPTPHIGQNQTCIFENDEWVIKPDFRGSRFFDTTTLTVVEITEIGEVSSNLISLESDRLINTLTNANRIDVYNATKNLIEAQYESDCKAPITIGKHLFYISQIPNLINKLKEVDYKIKSINKTIKQLEDVAVKQNIEAQNETKNKILQLEQQKQNITIELTVFNKRNKQIPATLDYKELASIVTKLQKILKNLKERKNSTLVKLNKLNTYELLVMQQRLISNRGNYVSTRDEENLKDNC